MTQSIDPEHGPDAAMKFTCEQVTELIIDYVTGDMDTTLRAAFERHLHNCPDCIAFLNTYQHTIRATRSLHSEEVPAEMLNRVQRVLRERLESESPGR